MNLLSIYHHLPYPLRVIAASARGYVLRGWRYGPETERLVEEALQRETWPREKIEEWQQARLVETLDWAAREVPYYREFWMERRRKGDRATWDILANWPVLKKSAIRNQPLAFIADSFRSKRLFREHTSGTTGTPLTLSQTREALIGWYALVEARTRRWNGVNHKTRWAILGGQMVTEPDATQPPYWIWNQAFSQLYLSAYHLKRETVNDYLLAMRKTGVEYLYGYPSAMDNLATLAIETCSSAPQLSIVLSNAEPLFPYQVEHISTVLGCPVRNSYGLSEQVCGASECDHGHLHIWPEAGFLEILADDADQPMPVGNTGRIVATGLLNRAMPLIRYEIGDRGSLGTATSCACGRTLSILDAVEGRMDDVIRTPDGRRIGRLDPVFKADLPIQEAQIIQERLDRIIVKYVPAPGLETKHLLDLEKRLTDRLGAMQIQFEPVEHIHRGANGKFRAVISRI